MRSEGTDSGSPEGVDDRMNVGESGPGLLRGAADGEVLERGLVKERVVDLAGELVGNMTGLRCWFRNGGMGGLYIVLLGRRWHGTNDSR